MIRGDNWIHYRWNHPFSKIVSEVNQDHPNAIILTNTRSVFFYSRDKYGFTLQHRGKYAINQKIFGIPLRSDNDIVNKELLNQLAITNQVIYINHAGNGSFLINENIVTNLLNPYRFKFSHRVGYLEMSKLYQKNHPNINDSINHTLSSRRIVVSYFNK